jgi:hypothetical protein
MLSDTDEQAERATRKGEIWLRIVGVILASPIVGICFLS